MTGFTGMARQLLSVAWEEDLKGAGKPAVGVDGRVLGYGPIQGVKVWCFAPSMGQ